MKKLAFILLAMACMAVFTSCYHTGEKADDDWKGEDVEDITSDIVFLCDNASEYILDNVKEEYQTGESRPHFYKDYPNEYIVLLKTREEFIQTIKENTSIECDFEKENIIVYSFTTMEGVDDSFKLKTVKKKGEKIKITFEKPIHTELFGGWVSTPNQRWFLLKIKKMEIESESIEIILE